MRTFAEKVVGKMTGLMTWAMTNILTEGDGRPAGTWLVSGGGDPARGGGEDRSTTDAPAASSFEAEVRPPPRGQA